MRFWTWIFAAGIIAALLFSHSITAHAYPANQCAGSRYGSNLGCTANDVSITNIQVVGDTTSCTGGSPVTVDLQLTVNFQSPSRYDIGIFISNDGKNPQLTVANGGSASCSVAILPLTSPFLNLDGNGCGDGNGTIGGGTGSGILYMPGVTLTCQSITGGGGNLYIPFVVSWNQSSGGVCTSIADPVPGTTSKCNAPTVAQGSVNVVVMPTITNTDGIQFVKSGDSTVYSVVITNTTGVTLSGAVFKDPAVTNINVGSVTCSAAGGASCPAVTVAAMQGAGITIPDMPANSSVTFTINATMAGNPPDTLTNTASVTVNGQTTSVSDTDTVVGTISIIPSSLVEYGAASTLMVFNYTLYNFGASSDTIGLSALSGNGWTVTLSAPSITVPSGGSSNFTVRVQIPAGAAIGTVDVTTITAISGNDPGKTASATAVTNVAAPLSLTPNNTGAGGKGSSVYYDHRVQNNTAASQTVNFATVLSGACTGWASGIYKANGVNQIPPATVILPPFGGYENIVVKLTIPATANTGDICTATTTATAAGNSAPATDVTTVKALVLYSDPGYTNESYLFPAGNAVYARAYGTAATNYIFYWYDSNNVLKRTSPNWAGPGTVPDTYTIPAAGPLGTWRVDVKTSGGVLFAQVNFYVGPDHVNASYTGANPVNTNTNVTINLSLRDRNDVVPLDPSGNLVKGNPPTTKDPLQITVTVGGAATIVATTLTGAVIVGQTVTGKLDGTTGTATITITDSAKETVTVTPVSYDSALYGSPARDEPATVSFVNRKMRIIYWREMVN